MASQTAKYFRYAATLVFVCGLVALGLELLSERREAHQLAKERQGHQKRIAELYKKRQNDNAYLKALGQNPDFFERVARERLGYSRQGEIIFQFNEPESDAAEESRPQSR